MDTLATGRLFAGYTVAPWTAELTGFIDPSLFRLTLGKVDLRSRLIVMHSAAANGL